MIDKPDPAQTPSPDERIQRLGLEPDDFYWSPEGYMIFTEKYHLKRGACCGNGCRHCPYEHKAVKRVQG
jgi:hypothetical protein